MFGGCPCADFGDVFTSTPVVVVKYTLDSLKLELIKVDNVLMITIAKLCKICQVQIFNGTIGEFPRVFYVRRTRIFPVHCCFILL